MSSRIQTVDEPVKKKRKRAPNIPWNESYELIITVEKNGKNWAKNLRQLHSKHLFTNINDPSTLRKHYNGLASEKKQSL